MAYFLYVLLLIVSIIQVTIGAFSLSQATEGVGVIAGACFTAILARIAQAAHYQSSQMGRLERIADALEGERTQEPATQQA